MELSLIVRGQHRQGEDMRARLADDIDLVMRAEELGFNALVKGSHYSAHPLQSLQQIPFLAQAAVLAPSLRLVCGLVLLPLHKPLDIAEQLATLDIMCGGKLVFGCGIGYRDVEFKAFGLTRKEAAKRFEECLLAVKRLWTEDFVDMAGSHFVLDHANSTVKPLQEPMPPVWIGANADGAIRRAARLGDCWYINPHSTLTTLARQLDLYKRALDECGKPFPAESMLRYCMSRHGVPRRAQRLRTSSGICGQVMIQHAIRQDPRVVSGHWGSGRDERSLRGSFVAHQPPEGGFDRGLRTVDRRQRLVLLPASAEGLVERHQLERRRLFGNRELVLQRIFLALRIEHIEEVGEAAVVSFRC